MIRLRDVTKNFRIGDQTIKALDNVSLTIEGGEFAAIVGPSGSGKTTLLNILGCIEKPDSGEAYVAGASVSALTPDQLADVRRARLGYVFQTFNLLPVLTAQENVEFPLLRSGLPAAERGAKALAALREVGLERLAAHKPAELSGGQRQRVAIARALIASPVLILADEPTANLDHATGLEIIALMKDINRRTKTTFLFSTHDPKIVDRADRVFTLTDGKIVRS